MASGKNRQDRKEQRQAEKIKVIEPTRTLHVLEQTQPNADYLRIAAVRWLPLGFSLHFSHLRILNLRGCSLTRLPFDFDVLRQLEHLDVSENPDLVLPASLLKCYNLQRLICSSHLLAQPEDWLELWQSDVQALPTLATRCCITLLQTSDTYDLDLLNKYFRHHDVFVSLHQLDRCYECHHLGLLTTSRIRIATVAMRRIPLCFPLCSERCLLQRQATWLFEDELNEEKRSLRLSKFGGEGRHPRRLVRSSVE